MQCSAVQSSAVKYNTVQCSAVQCSRMQHCYSECDDCACSMLAATPLVQGQSDSQHVATGTDWHTAAGHSGRGARYTLAQANS